MLHLFLTLVVGLAVGFLLYKLKIPGGMLVGAIIGVAILNVGFEAAYMPLQAKILAQAAAGAYIGSTVERSDILRMPRLLKPAGIILGLYLVLNVTLGLLIYRLSPLDKITAFFCAVPGGISDIPLIAEDMGADAPKVALVQFVRMAVGVGIFPSMINYFCNRGGPEERGAAAVERRAETADKRPVAFLATMAVALLCGYGGYRLGLPSGTLVFALFGILILKLSTGWSYLPMWCKRAAQALSGAYIGSSMTMADILEIPHLAVPILLVVTAYLGNCFLMGALLRRFCGMTRKEGMLAATPAGASDMALISMDMGIRSPDLIVLQIVRLVVVVSGFPPVLGVILKFVH